ncbi:unnamed protein product [Periconia digitata]|uniref:Uncharacterized protein n=1 Tax=Periconia digitata TaxID=1303443 RepID=A0A9W4XX56_9PLEO|nr:unnamed protein product [Periconia digitata]
MRTTRSRATTIQIPSTPTPQLARCSSPNTPTLNLPSISVHLPEAHQPLHQPPDYYYLSNPTHTTTVLLGPRHAIPLHTTTISLLVETLTPHFPILAVLTGLRYPERTRADTEDAMSLPSFTTSNHETSASFHLETTSLQHRKRHYHCYSYRRSSP